MTGKTRKRILAILMTVVCVLGMLVMPDAGHAQAAGSVAISGRAHVQTFGDQNGKIQNQNGIQTLVLGTRGLAKRVESITVNLKNQTGYTGTLQYRVHRQTFGWTNWVSAGKPAGTTGLGKRLEGIQMRLTGELAKHYDVRYCAHIQTYGDNQGWVYNGALAGTTGEAKRLEEIRVQIVPKKSISTQPSVLYRVHRQTYGWENVWAQDGMTSGTTGEGKRLEGITITVNDNAYSGGITYQTHVQSYGWMDWVSNGEMSGTQGQAKRLEAIRIKLTGQLANYYDVYYQVHSQTYGWLNWVKNGAISGTVGEGKRLEAIRIRLVKKDSSDNSGNGTTTPGNNTGNNTGNNSGNNSGSGTTTPGNNSGTVYCQHQWKTEKFHVEGVSHTEYVLDEKYVSVPGERVFCNWCHSQKPLVAFGSDNDENYYPCIFCGEPGWHLSSITESGGYIRYVNAKQVVDEPEYNAEITYCTKCNAVLADWNYSDDEMSELIDKWKESKNPKHTHSWVPVLGKHHDSMIIQGSYRSDIASDFDLPWTSGRTDECRNCGLNMESLYHTTTLETYNYYLSYWFWTANTNNTTTVGTPGLNDAAIEHIKKCYGTDTVNTFEYDEVTGYKCKTCQAVKECSDKNVEYNTVMKKTNSDIQTYISEIENRGGKMPVDYSLVETEIPLIRHKDTTYQYKIDPATGEKIYTHKYIGGEGMTPIGKYRLEYTWDYTSYDVYFSINGEDVCKAKWLEEYRGKEFTVKEILEFPRERMLEEYVRYVRKGNLYYKYEVNDGKLGKLLQIYDLYFEPVE